MADSDLYLTTKGEITSIANAIRSKSGISNSLIYPADFVSAINAINLGPTASDAILTVIVSTGATVTATRGSIVLTPILWVEVSNNNYECALFIIRASQFSSDSWTVTASNNTDTASKNVVINSNKHYNLELEFNYYIIKKGNAEYNFTNSNATKGVGPVIDPYTGDKISAFTMKATSNNGKIYLQLTDSSLNEKAYTQLVIEILEITGTNGSTFSFGISTNYSISYFLASNSWKGTAVTYPYTTVIDISGITLVNNYLVINSSYADNGLVFYNLYFK